MVIDMGDLAAGSAYMVVYPHLHGDLHDGQCIYMVVYLRLHGDLDDPKFPTYFPKNRPSLSAYLPSLTQTPSIYRLRSPMQLQSPGWVLSVTCNFRKTSIFTMFSTHLTIIFRQYLHPQITQKTAYHLRPQV